MSATNQVFAGLRVSRAGATSKEVPKLSLTAATDGQIGLEYVATDDIKPWIAARRETSEAEYMEFMRERVAPKAA